jgi:hypothetical protein
LGRPFLVLAQGHLAGTNTDWRESRPHYRNDYLRLCGTESRKDRERANYALRPEQSPDRPGRTILVSYALPVTEVEGTRSTSVTGGGRYP